MIVVLNTLGFGRVYLGFGWAVRADFKCKNGDVYQDMLLVLIREPNA